MSKKARSLFMMYKEKVAILYLFISPLLFAITTIPTTSAQSASEPIYLVKFIINSTSGWTTVSIDGIAPFAQNASLLSGFAIPGFQYSCESGYITMGRSTLDEIPATVELMCLTFRGNQSGQVRISKGHNGYTEVTAYVYSAGSWSQLAHFLHEGVNLDEPYLNTRIFIINYAQAYALLSHHATIELVPASIRKSVYAFYYPWYLTPKGPSGEMFHCDGGYAHEPFIGRYDSMDERVIEAHMRMAKAASIDGFIINFNGVGRKDERAVPAILRVADALDFPISFYECADRPYLKSEDMVDELSYIIRTYSHHKSFLRVNGAPVIFVYAVCAGDRDLSFWSKVATELRKVVGSVYLIGDLSLPPDLRFAEAFDGLHWYGAPDTVTASQAYGLYKEKMRLGLKGMTWDQAIMLFLQGKILPLQEKYLVFTVEPGYDHTKIGGNAYLDREDGQTYEEFWRAALSNDPDGILITSWNEWHEGSEIEPSVEYGFAYLNLTRQYASLYKGTEQPKNSPALKIQTDLMDVLRYGLRNASLCVLNDSPSVQALYVNISIALSDRLKLICAGHSGFYSYAESTHLRTYNLLMPMLKPSEVIAFNITLNASVGLGSLSAAATCYSPSQVAATATITSRVKVIHDRVSIDLGMSTPRVEVGSKTPITMSAHYEYNEQPFTGEVYLNDTLMKSSPGCYAYTVKSISDDLYGLTEFSSNTVSVIFDRIIARQTVDTLSPGTISVNMALMYESDGLLVDDAKVTVNGLPAIEVGKGNYQATITTLNPLFQLDITVNKSGFASQMKALSGYALGNILLEVAMPILVIAFIMILFRHLRHP